MPWMIGIDEAGYGPNLGPFVMTAVAFQVPEQLLGANLWRVLRTAVRRPSSEDDGRLLIEDSKVVYSPARGLFDLETGVIAALGAWQPVLGLSLRSFLDQLCPAHHPEIQAEPWYTGNSIMPLVVELQKLEQAAALFQRTCRKKQLAFALASSVAVCPKRFNDWLDQWGSKGGILGEALKQLIGHCLVASQENETLHFFIDKHGGRNNYSAMLQNAIPDGLVVANGEAMECSAYQFLGLKRDISITIQPRADAKFFCVALASMVSKYVRELLMVEFNRFWQTHVPGLKATAGYPVDSARFYEEIRPTVERLGFAEATVWRRK